jgi:hypothetical protein
MPALARGSWPTPEGRSRGSKNAAVGGSAIDLRRCLRRFALRKAG